ncbi:hypothetical protein CPT_Shady_063 [Streptomyces phage Shady]|uniref:Uncharacterized protein n=1 Tax=Streptomyces phage Shady TaxID=2767585 RepID=A0A873WVU0_9CAUD|nr:hypothetical protein CPT_Shady_063 [Streptomyces phage Shady]
MNICRTIVPIRKTQGGVTVDVTARLDVTVDLWVETSADGRVWKRSERVPGAQETGRDCKELMAILRAYTRVIETIGPMYDPVSCWFRIVIQGTETGRVLAMVPRHWNELTQTYDPTGGDWVITDYPDAYFAWIADLMRVRVSAKL